MRRRKGLGFQVVATRIRPGEGSLAAMDDEAV